MPPEVTETAPARHRQALPRTVENQGGITSGMHARGWVYPRGNVR